LLRGEKGFGSGPDPGGDPKNRRKRENNGCFWLRFRVSCIVSRLQARERSKAC